MKNEKYFTLNKKPTFYIAYGSNLHIEQMRHRCPNAVIAGTGVIPDMSLVYRKLPAGSGAYATIEKCCGDYVPVVLWKLGYCDERRLDQYEGYPSFYYKEDVEIIMDNGIRKCGMVYIMNKECVPGQPSDTYLRTIFEGYLANKLEVRIFNQSIERNDYEINSILL